MALPSHAYRAKRIPGTRHFETIGQALDALDPTEEIVLYCGTVAIGIVLDTFVVRALLVPAITLRLDDRAWWPARTRKP